MIRNYYHLEYSYVDALEQHETKSQHFKTEEQLERFLEELLSRDDIFIYCYKKSKIETVTRIRLRMKPRGN